MRGLTEALNRLDRPSGPSDRARPWVRAFVAAARAELEPTAGSAAQIARRLWPTDSEVPKIIERAASAPATTTTSGWASELTTTVMADLILTLAPASAGAQLMRLAALNFEFDRAGAIRVPGVLSTAVGGGFVLEGAPIPVRELVFGGALLEPKKLGVITVVTSELFRHSTPTAERLVRAVVGENIAAALDAALFDATAGSATRPSGLRNGVAALTAASGGGIEAMTADVGSVVAAVAPAAAGSQIAIVAAPGEAAKILLWAGDRFPFPVLSSSGLAAGEIVGVALSAFTTAISPEPTFDVSKEALVHSDSVPSAISTSGSPNAVSAPTRSLFQTDAVALKLTLPVSWGLRTAGAIAHVAGVTW